LKNLTCLLEIFNFKDSSPLSAKCDCSGFVCWSIGVPRECPPGSDHWLFTDNIWAGGGDVGSALFHRVDPAAATPGDLYVYPHDHSHSFGHIGIVTETSSGHPTRMIHCSHGNYSVTRDAVRVTAPNVISGNPQSRIMRPDYDAIRRVCGVAATAGISVTPEPRAMGTAAAVAPSCNRRTIDTLTERIYLGHGHHEDRHIPIYELPAKTGYFYKAKMSVDVDGCPKAYHPTNDAIALDYLANASKESKRYIQGVMRNGHTGIGPNHGYFVSATSLQQGPDWDCGSYVDGHEIPYVVFPAEFHDARVGDAAVVINLRNWDFTHAIFADTNSQVGEASYKVATTFGMPNPSPKNGGDDHDNYVYLIFPGVQIPRAGNSPFWPNDKIRGTALQAFTAWGGIEQVKACFSSTEQ
jgi:hypothetical protein